MLRPPPISTLFPYTTLFRSGVQMVHARRLHPDHDLTCLRLRLRQIGDLQDLGAAVLPDEDRFHGVGTGQTPLNRSEEYTSELQSHSDLVCRLLLEKKKNIKQ